MLRIALLVTLVAATLAQNLEDCSSGGPEFWCASCGNAGACSALIPGLVDYCEQIGIFTRGQCGGEEGTGESDTVTIPPTTNPPTAPDPTVGEDDKLAPEQPTQFSTVSTSEPDEEPDEPDEEPDEADEEPGTAYTDESWVDWACFMQNKGVIPTMASVYGEMDMDPEQLNVGKETCWDNCRYDPVCKGVSFSPMMGSTLSGNFVPAKCYLTKTETLADSYLWESALKSCWEFKSIIPQPNCYPGSGCVAPFPDDMPLIPPYINIAPINITVPPGATAQFKCASIGAPAPTITIMSRDEALSAYNAPTYEEWILARDGVPETSAVNIIQEIEDVTQEHEGWYRCMAGNVQGAVYEDAYLQVLDLCGTITCESPKVCEADYILSSAQCGCGEPCDTTFDVICGFDCNTYFNPCQLDQMNCESETNIGIWTQGMCPTVERPRVTAAYLERAFEEDNRLREDMEIAVDVRTIERVNEGEYFIMFCQATGNPPPQLSWWKDGQMIFQGSDYEVPEASFDDAGVYTCRAMNCIYGGEKENEHESNGIEVQIAERAAGEPLGIPCQVFGDPHVVTFDNKLYDYMGDCNYVLSMDCEWGEWIVYGNFKQCGPKETGYPASCLVDVTVFYNNIGLNLQRGWIVVHRGEKVPLKMNGEVDIMESNQPTGIKIGYDGLYVTVTLPNGIMVTWDGIISTQVILLKDSVRQTCGLCGNNDGDASNEFFARFQNDVNVDSINMFGNSWEVDRMDACVPIEEEMKANEICDMYPDRRDEGLVRCPEVFNNPIWTECKEFLSTEGYEEKCRYDFCALEDMKELLLADCGTAAAYAQQCKAISGIYINQARWRDAVNCPTVADQQEGTLPYGCPQQTFPWNGTSTIVL